MSGDQGEQATTTHRKWTCFQSMTDICDGWGSVRDQTTAVAITLFYVPFAIAKIDYT